MDFTDSSDNLLKFNKIVNLPRRIHKLKDEHINIYRKYYFAMVKLTT